MTNPDIEVLRLSAEACGYDVVYSESGEPCTFGTALAIRKNCIGPMTTWNPFEIPEQRDECIDELLKRGDVKLGDGNRCEFLYYGAPPLPADFFMFCPWREFPASALAEIERRKG
jgi:hypothetical protein